MVSIFRSFPDFHCPRAWKCAQLCCKLHVRGRQHPKLRLTADTEDNRENCQCMSLNMEHPSKHVNGIIFLSSGKQLLLGTVWRACKPIMWNALLLLQHSSKPEFLSHCGVIPVNFSFPYNVSFFLPEKNVHLLFPKNIMFSTTQYSFSTQAGIRHLYSQFTK